MAAILPDAASLLPLDYETSKRADPEVLKTLIEQAKFLRVRTCMGVGELGERVADPR